MQQRIRIEFGGSLASTIGEVELAPGSGGEVRLTLTPQNTKVKKPRAFKMVLWEKDVHALIVALQACLAVSERNSV